MSINLFLMILVALFVFYGIGRIPKKKNKEKKLGVRTYTGKNDSKGYPILSKGVGFVDMLDSHGYPTVLGFPYVGNREEFMEMFTPEGIPIRSFIVKRYVVIENLVGIKSLAGVGMCQGVTLSGLTDLEEFNGIAIAKATTSLNDLRVLASMNHFYFIGGKLNDPVKNNQIPIIHDLGIGCNVTSTDVGYQINDTKKGYSINNQHQNFNVRKIPKENKNEYSNKEEPQ